MTRLLALRRWLLLGVAVILLSACSPGATDTPETTGAPATATTAAPVATTTPPATTVNPVVSTTAAPSATTAPGLPPGLAPAIAAARADGVSFDFADYELCEWFTTQEMIGIITDAYRQEGAEWDQPTDLQTTTDIDAACRWDIPGRSLGFWGVVYVQPLNEQQVEDWIYIRDTVPLLDPRATWQKDMVHSGGGQATVTGMSVVEGHASLDIGHTVTGGSLTHLVDADPDTMGPAESILLRILNSMLHRMNWIPPTD